VELDERVTLPGAEGIDLDLVLAGIASRAAALVLDLVVQALLIGALAIGVTGLSENVAVSILAVGSFGVWFGYPILLEAFAEGQTVGKRALGIAVVRTDGTPAGFLAAAVRGVVKVIDLLPGVGTVGLVSMVATKRCQRLGDLAAGTLVVRRAARPQAVAGGPVGFDAVASGYAPPPGTETWDTTGLSLEELAAIRAFLDRRAQLDPGQRALIAQTLAEHVLPKVAGVPLDGGPEVFLERLAWARGRR
jgi:uncharacterized RDD family membrane protein YckC